MSVFTSAVLSIGGFIAIFWLGYDAQTITLFAVSIACFGITSLFLEIINSKGNKS